MTEHPGLLPPAVDTSRHYAETRRTNADGQTYHMHPYCPRCSVAWPCPSAAAEPGGAT